MTTDRIKILASRLDGRMQQDMIINRMKFLVSLLDNESSDLQHRRAINFIEAITPPLSYLADHGFLLFNSRLLCVFCFLENIENLLWFGIFVDMNGAVVDLKNGTDDQKRLYNEMFTKYCNNLRSYLQKLPHYSTVKPQKPHQPSVCPPDEEPNSKEQQSLAQTRIRVLEQHSIITGYLIDQLIYRNRSSVIFNIRT